MKGFEDSTIGNTVLHEVSSHQRMIESHAVPGHGIAPESHFRLLSISSDLISLVRNISMPVARFQQWDVL